MKNELIQLFSRDLDRLEKELMAYTDQNNLWKISNDIKNSGGNLALHICW